MAFEIPGFMRSWTAGGTAGTAGSDLSIPNTVNSIAIQSYQYMYVALVNGLIVPASSGNLTNIVGVLQNKPAPGQAAQVMVSGVSRIRSDDSTITIGTIVYADQYGFVSTTGTKTAHATGISEEVAATATGYVIAVLLKPLGALA